MVVRLDRSLLGGAKQLESNGAREMLFGTESKMIGLHENGVDYVSGLDLVRL